MPMKSYLPPVATTVFILPLLHRSQNLEGSLNLGWQRHLGLSTLKSLLSVCFSVVDLLVNNHIPQEEAFLMRVEWCFVLWTYKLGVTLFLCFFRRIIVVSFSPRPMTYIISGLGTQLAVRYGFYLMEWALDSLKKWLVALIIFIPLLQVSVVYNRVCSWVILMIAFQFYHMQNTI